jgi:predicted nucleic acid-binding protein
MTDRADANLVLAVIKPQDALHTRAVKHLGRSRLLVPFAVGIELLMICKKHGLLHEELIDLTEDRFDVENLVALRTAARALDKGRITTVFDAIHAAEALAAGARLHTADAKLLRSGFPTTGF